MNGNEGVVGFSPDGLSERVIDLLLREVDGAGVVRPRPVSVLVGGRAVQRRCRREARRCVSAVVRALPVGGASGGPDGWAA